MTRVYARIEQSRFGWWYTKSDDRMFGVDYTELYNFSFTKRGIERKARRKIKKLQDGLDHKSNAYEFYGDSNE